MTEEKVRAYFTIANIEILSLWELANQYWPRVKYPTDEASSELRTYIAYAKLRLESPWWLVKTSFGLIQIGWRKRVIEINWQDTNLKVDMPTNDTKSEYMVHAWDETHVILYLGLIKEEASKKGK